jgi:hypothetical protein
VRCQFSGVSPAAGLKSGQLNGKRNLGNVDSPEGINEKEANGSLRYEGQ